MEQHLLGEPVINTNRLEVLEGQTGRRTWPDNVKGQIVAESFEPGARVADVARRHGMAAQHLSTWRRLARDGKIVVLNRPLFAGGSQVSKDGAYGKE